MRKKYLKMNRLSNLLIQLRLVSHTPKCLTNLFFIILCNIKALKKESKEKKLFY